MDINIKKLKTFFTISNAAFEFTDTVQLTIGGHIHPNKMRLLHKMALEELEKFNPDLSIIDELLAEMESLAEFNSQQKTNLTKDHHV
jgi:DeoR/GlpR family transcriptional regulator of sugar metabolism